MDNKPHETAALLRRMDGVAVQFEMRMEESARKAGVSEEFEQWRHGFRMARKHPDNEAVREYNEVTCRMLVDAILARANTPTPSL